MPTQAGRSSSIFQVFLTGFDLAELDTFIAVVESGSFKAAADRMCVTQPAITNRIQRLEAALGASLLRRTTRKIEVTDQGKLLYAEAKNVLHDLRVLVTQFRADASESRTQIVVAATPVLAAYAMPHIIRDYALRYPDVNIELHDLQYGDVLAALDAKSADLAVVALDSLDSPGERYHFEPLRDETLVLVVPTEHPLSACAKIDLQELATYPLIMLDRYRSIGTCISAALRQKNLSDAHIQVAENLDTVIAMLDARKWITLLPDSVAVRLEAAGRKRVQFEGLDLHRTIGIVMRREAELSAATASLYDFIKQAVGPQSSQTPAVGSSQPIAW